MIARFVWLCPVCFSATDANRAAYLGTTILLSLVPLAFLVGVLWFLRERSRELAPSAQDVDAQELN